MALWLFCDWRFDFESAAYVARYCTKKITGKIADDYYQGKSCEFPL